MISFDSVVANLLFFTFIIVFSYSAVTSYYNQSATYMYFIIPVFSKSKMKFLNRVVVEPIV